MAVYKIPQDVEADDKFVGPLSFKQFIYAGIAVISIYLTFLSLTRGFWPALIFFFPIIVAAGFLAFPWGRDQTTEVWLAARIRFFIKPRLRIWNQSGIKELVTVTAPKHIEKFYTNGLSQNEVSSRLSGLADLLDSRGWAVKNVNVNLYSNPLHQVDDEDDDRLLEVSTLPQEVVEVTAGDDVLDEASSPTAQHFDEMIKTSEEKRRQEIMQQLQTAREEPSTSDTDEPAKPDKAKADFWLLGQKGGQREDGAALPVADTPVLTTFQAPSVVTPATASSYAQPVPVTLPAAPEAAAVTAQDEEALLQKLHKEHATPDNTYGHLKTILPMSEQRAPSAQPAPAPDPVIVPVAAVTPPVNPVIMKLASNDDLNVATLARQAGKTNPQHLSDDEVVISLH